jgi:hypothetical protein
VETGTDTRGERAEPRRSDRWSSEASRPERNGWVVLGTILVLAGYGLAFAVVSAARGSFDLPDDAAKALVAATPAVAGLGSALAFVATRRSSLRPLSWIVVVVGTILVLATIAVVAWLLLALRSFE